jgi:hypothetical protein
VQSPGTSLWTLTHRARLDAVMDKLIETYGSPRQPP